MSIAEKFVAMEYGPAPEDPKEVLAWLDQHGRRFGHFIDGAWRQPAEGGYFDTTDPSTGEKLADVAQGSAADIDAAVRAAAECRSAKMASAHSARASSLSLRAGADHAETLPPFRGARDHGQRQADPREPRHRYSAGHPALLSPRRMGAVAAAGISRIHSVRRRRTDHSLEFSRCSCWPGRLRRLWPPATQSC